MEQVACPRCGAMVGELINVDSGFRQRLANAGVREAVPDRICQTCFRELQKKPGTTSNLLAREKAREENRTRLWKSRVTLIRRARAAMNAKMLAEAAVAYEKYIRCIEIVFNAKPGGLTPDMFKDAAQTKELTVVASAYWDLLRIYDSNNRYAERQSQAAAQLAKFIRFTPVYPDIMRKAQAFQKEARNPTVIKQFIKQANLEKGRCFIATASFHSAAAPEVQILRRFRDQKLSKTKWGRGLIHIYYLISPPLANWLYEAPRSRRFSRWLIRKSLLWLPIDKEP